MGTLNQGRMTGKVFGRVVCFVVVQTSLLLPFDDLLLTPPSQLPFKILKNFLFTILLYTCVKQCT